jgi:hypothetical protein
LGSYRSLADQGGFFDIGDRTVGPQQVLQHMKWLTRLAHQLVK